MSADRKEPDNEPESELMQQGLAFLHQARAEVRELHPKQIERIERRLKKRRHRPRQRVLWPAMATLGLVLVAGATFAVAKGGLRSLPLVGTLFAPESKTEESKSEKRRQPALLKNTVGNPPVALPSLGDSPIAPPIQPSSEPAKISADHPVQLLGPGPRMVALRDPGYAHESARAAQLPKSPASLPPAVMEENPIIVESRSFASVIEPWHRTHDPSTALALLDAHEQHYPSGHMRLESHMLRAEIYLAQGRESEALTVLDALSLTAIPRARELQTVRGELRIKAGRCAEGKRDLDDVLQKSVADPLAKRATQAISHCP
jgi:hypothetical protein